MEGANIRKLGFLALFVGLFVLVARLFYPFLSIILWSGLIYVILRKPFRRLVARLGGGEAPGLARSAAAGLFSVGSVAAIVAVIVLLGTAVLRQFGDLASGFMKAMEGGSKLVDLSPASPIGGAIYGLTGGQVDLSGVDLAAELRRFFAEEKGRLIGFSGLIIKDAAALVVGLAFMVFTLFFFFADGERLAETFIASMPLERSYTLAFLRKFRDSGKQLLVGYFLVGLFQALMMFAICLVMGVKGAAVLAALTLPAAFIPMIGTGLVWIPVSLGLALGGEITKAAVYLVLCAILVSTLDNFLRPLLLHERLKIHPLLIFLAILGGLQIFGFNGIIIGPLILMLFFCSLELMEDVYAGETGRGENSEEEER